MISVNDIELNNYFKSLEVKRALSIAHLLAGLPYPPYVHMDETHYRKHFFSLDKDTSIWYSDFRKCF